MASPVGALNSNGSFFLDPSSERRSSGNCFGHFFEDIGHGIADIGEGVFGGCKKVVKALGDVRSDPNCFARMIKLSVSAFSLVELGIGKPGACSKVSSRLLMTDGMIDNFQVLDSGGFFGGVLRKDEMVDGKVKKAAIKEASVPLILGQAAIFAASLGGLALFLGKVTLLNLGKIGASLGKVPVFGAITRLGVSLGTMVTGLVGVAFIGLGINAAMDLAKAKTCKEKTKAFLETVWCASEVFWKTAIVMGLANPWALMAIGGVSSSLGIAQFLYGLSVKDKPKTA